MKFLFYLILMSWTSYCAHEATTHASTTRAIGYCYLAGALAMSLITYKMWW